VTGQVLGAPARPPAPASRYGALPGGGQLLAVNDRGLFAFGVGGAPRQMLGRIDIAAWSPHGRFAVAVRGIELIAVSLRGLRHWSFAAPRTISSPAWSPSGYRIAFVVGGPGVGRAIHVVAGDGTGEHLLAATTAAPPAWQPGVAPAERLATVDSAQRVVLRDADSGHVLWRARTPGRPTRLAWAGNRRLFVLERDRLTILDGATGARVGTARAPTDTTNMAVAVRPRHTGVAIVRRNARGASRVMVGKTTIFSTPGKIAAIAWSPHGDWLAIEEAGVDGWTLLHLAGRKVDRTRTLAAGRGAQLSGWCCA
jgi:dipeptidyl aminopeptidase/acylaminoacyl peptidase